MKIILTHAYFIEEDYKELAIMRPYVPLGILYISAYLQENGYQNEVFDSTFSTFEKLKQHLLSNKPDVLAIYTNLMTKLNVLRIIKFIRSTHELQHCKIVLGGPEVTNHIEKFLKYGADIIVFGEGEQTMLALMQCFETPEKHLDHIDGIAFYNDKKELHKNAERNKIKDLDVLPLPARTKVNLQLYFDAWKNKHGMSTISVSTMRGCPYSCKWCSRAVYGQTYRRRSAKAVAEELEWIKNNYQVDTVWFVDDVFTISHRWLEAFTHEVTERGISMPFECITRADRLNEEVIINLKKAGCFRVWIGAESGSQKVIDLMDRRVEVTQVRAMITLAQAHGIQAGTFIMVGYPGETEEDLYETVHHLKISDPDLFTITVAYPIKGTALYDEVKNNFIEDLPWENSTDRDIDFKRTHKRRYYDFAVRMIVNEVMAAKARKKGLRLLYSKLKMKAALSKGGMWIYS